MNKKKNSKSVLQKIKNSEKSFCFNPIVTPKKIWEQTNSEFDLALIKNKNKQVEESKPILQRKITNDQSEFSIGSNSEIRLSNGNKIFYFSEQKKKQLYLLGYLKKRYLKVLFRIHTEQCSVSKENRLNY